TVPAETILVQGSLPWIISSILLAIALLFFSTKFLQFALRFYTSASS
ncbi:MAG: ABC-2 family transporter protein, partial [Microcoleaceae cyanobacterium]